MADFVMPRLSASTFIEVASKPCLLNTSTAILRTDSWSYPGRPRRLATVARGSDCWGMRLILARKSRVGGLTHAEIPAYSDRSVGNLVLPKKLHPWNPLLRKKEKTWQRRTAAARGSRTPMESALTTQRMLAVLSTMATLMRLVRRISTS